MGVFMAYLAYRGRVAHSGDRPTGTEKSAPSSETFPQERSLCRRKIYETTKGSADHAALDARVLDDACACRPPDSCSNACLLIELALKVL